MSPLSNFHPNPHESEGVFRITVPAIMKVLSISKLSQLLILQWFIDLAIYMMLAFLFLEITNSFLLSLVSILTISFSYFGRVFFMDTYPWLDTFAFFMLSGIVFHSNLLLGVLSIICLFFCY